MLEYHGCLENIYQGTAVTVQNKTLITDYEINSNSKLQGLFKSLFAEGTSSNHLYSGNSVQSQKRRVRVLFVIMDHACLIVTAS